MLLLLLLLLFRKWGEGGVGRGRDVIRHLRGRLCICIQIYVNNNFIGIFGKENNQNDFCSFCSCLFICLFIYSRAHPEKLVSPEGQEGKEKRFGCIFNL